MEGNVKAIEIKGIVRNKTKIGVQDGQAEDLINLRFVNDSWRTSGDGRMVFTDTVGYSQLYIHTMSMYRHLLGVRSGKLWWFANIATDGVTFEELAEPVALTDVEGDLWITQTGHLLTVIELNNEEANGFQSIIFRTNTNEYFEVNIDRNGSQTNRELYPFGQIHFNFAHRPYIYDGSGRIAGAFDATYNAVSYGSETSPSMCHAALLEERESKEKLSLFTRPFLVLAVVRLYDGSSILATPPIYMHQREAEMKNYPGQEDNKDFAWCYGEVFNSGNKANKWLALGNDGTVKYSDPGGNYLSPPFSCSGYYAKGDSTSRIMANVYSSYLCVHISQIDDLINNPGVYSGLDIYITPQAEVFRKELKTGEYAIGSFVTNRQVSGNDFIWNVAYMPEYGTNKEISKFLMGSPFYLLKSYSLPELKKFKENPIINLIYEPDQSVLYTITQQTPLEYESFSRTTYLPKCAYNYNGRLHIANYKTSQFHGFPIDFSHLHNHALHAKIVPNEERSGEKYISEDLFAHLSESAAIDNSSQKEKHKYNFVNYPALINAGAPYLAIVVKIDTDEGEQQVCRYIKAYDTTSNQEQWKPNYIESLNPLLTFPDKRAKSMDIYIPEYNNVLNAWVVRKGHFDLQPHALYNFAYYIDPDLNPIDLNDFPYDSSEVAPV